MAKFAEKYGLTAFMSVVHFAGAFAAAMVASFDWKRASFVAISATTTYLSGKFADKPGQE